MSEFGINTIGTITNGDIFASYKNVRSIPCTVLIGEGVCVRGTVMGKVTASGKLAIWDTGAQDGRETIYGILGEEVDATSADVDAYVFVDGEFLKDKLTADVSVVCGVFSNIVIVEEEY